MSRVVAPPRPQPPSVPVAGVPEVLFPEARRRRRRRWLVGAAAGVVAVAGAGVGAASVGGAGGGTDGGAGRATASGAPSPSPATVDAAAGSGPELAGGRWLPVAPPHPGVATAWSLAAWTGTYVIAWGRATPCCGTRAGGSKAASTEHGAAFDPVRGSWRSLPPAPVAATVGSTTWTGRELLVWGATPSAGHASTPSAGHSVLLAFDPATWRWRRLSPPPMAPRSDAQVLWNGTRLVVVGGRGPTATVMVGGATYDPRTNRWRVLPTIPGVAAPPGSTETAVGTTATWDAGALYLWVTRQVVRPTGAGGAEIAPRVQTLRWRPGTSRWQRGPALPRQASALGATVVPMGRSIALLGGTSCLPAESCPAPSVAPAALLDVRTDEWSLVPPDAVLQDARSFAWTGHRLIAIRPYVTDGGYLVGGFAAAFDPATGSWTSLPELPVPTAPPSGPVLTGTVWAGSELIDADVRLVPGHRSTGRGPGAGAVPSCPPIAFPELVGGQFCGPPPGPGTGSGPGGSCLGTEAAPPCGPGMAAGRYYPYTLFSACTNVYLDGRWWRNELPGGSGPRHVWAWVNATATAAGWTGPLGGVGFVPSTATGCS